MVNLLYDEVLFSFRHREGAVTALSFLTDSDLGLSLLASTSQGSGQVVFWDLNAKKIWCSLQAPHNGGHITHLQFIPNEPVLVSSSEEDNSIKMWLFEKGQSKPRLLKERSGHASAPH